LSPQKANQVETATEMCLSDEGFLYALSAYTKER